MTGWAFYGLLALCAAVLTVVNLEHRERGWAVVMGLCSFLFGTLAFMSALVGA